MTNEFLSKKNSLIYHAWKQILKDIIHIQAHPSQHLEIVLKGMHQQKNNS